jgi:hypothetical protein
MVQKAFGVWLRMFMVRCVREVKRELDTPYPPASEPGHAPHKRTGGLQDSVSHAIVEKNKVGYVTVDAEYASYLLKGTARMKPRPFGLKAIKKAAGAMRGAVAISSQTRR